jgi:SpoVK/Ycf46/Vps4 family AAA+-type ATPase
MRIPCELPPEVLSRISDPSRNGVLERNLREKVLHPITKNWIRRPAKASFLLYGPPGSRKTSLVKTMAITLGWPLIILSPPSFLSDGGLEGFEASADKIFRNLMRLRRVVILFDECEDFFKIRQPSNKQQIESRTIGAFITSGMLPRLQALRDQQWVLFFLATNSELNEFDPAVIRPGRFDYAERLGYPEFDAQLRYLAKKTKLNTTQRKAVEKALESYEKNRGASKDENICVSFSLVDMIERKLLSKELAADPMTIMQELQQLISVSIPPSLSNP